MYRIIRSSAGSTCACYISIEQVDGDLFLSDEHKIDCQRDIQQYITEELNEANLDVTLSYYLTSIYDHSVFEAFSKVHLTGLLHAVSC
jgi:Gtr1/RagA G protein conserved region